MSNSKQIGFSLKVKLDWLETTSSLVESGQDPDTIKETLGILLQDQLAGGIRTNRGSRQKTISVLMKAWVTVPSHLQSLRDDAVDLFRTLPKDDHLVLHWGMCIAAYPFLGAVAETVGRLVRLQETVSASQVQRRILEQFGERETVSVATRRILRSFVDWGVLNESGKKGVYEQADPRLVSDDDMICWLMEALLYTLHSSSEPFQKFKHSPIIFPFVFSNTGAAGIVRSKRLTLNRQGLDEELVALRNWSTHATLIGVAD